HKTTPLFKTLDNTGLPSEVQQLNCVGPATPVPDWSSYVNTLSAIPTTCADGSNGTVFANAAPNVFLFARDFAAPRSVRSNLQWNVPVLGLRLMATIDGVCSRSHEQLAHLRRRSNPD